MVVVRLRHRLGNNMLQYCMGRMLATKYNYALQCNPIDGFERTKDVIDGQKYDTPIMGIRHNKVDLEKVDRVMASHNYKVKLFVNGTFSYYPMFEPYKKEMKKWMEAPPVNLNVIKKSFAVISGDKYVPITVDAITPKDVLLHIRLGDLLTNDSLREDRALFFDYYNTILSRIKFDRLFVISDSIKSKYVMDFREYNPICLLDASAFDTLMFFKLFNRIIISRGTYAWWGAYLSDAREIYFPIATKGIWGKEQNDVDLKVDEDRYIYVSEEQKTILGGYLDAIKFCQL